jgi:pSer/pThr/pTyr-binding forkhead associated (FHA) protein
MLRVADLVDEAKRLSADAFAAAHPTPALLYNPPEDDSARAFKTSVGPGPDERQEDVAIGPDTAVVFLAPREDSASHLRVTLGRATNVDVCLPYPKISKLHAIFTWSEATYQVLDVGSTNGTYVNGKRLAPKTAEAIPDGALLNFWHIGARFCSAVRLHAILVTL